MFKPTSYLTILDEAYWGKESVINIETAMRKIHDKLKEDPKAFIQSSPLNKELEKAIVDTFGVAEAHVYWCAIGSKGGPFTLPGCRIMPKTEKDRKNMPTPGKQMNGYYDNSHSLVMFVQMENFLVTGADLSPAEMTAILLHEIGHNFDWRPESIAEEISKDIDQNIVRNYKYFMDYYNSDSKSLEYQQKHMPGLANFRRASRKIRDAINNFKTSIDMTLMAPLTKAAYSNLDYYYKEYAKDTRSEAFADTFAACYGYGPEIPPALDKYIRACYVNKPEKKHTGLMGFFYDMTLFQYDYITWASTGGGHRSDQQRMDTIIKKLKSDLNDPELDAATKKVLQNEINRAENMYKAMVALDDDKSGEKQKAVRKRIDMWIDSKEYKKKEKLFEPSEDSYA